MESLVSDIPAGEGKTANLFYSVVNWREKQRAKQKKRTYILECLFQGCWPVGEFPVLLPPEGDSRHTVNNYERSRNQQVGQLNKIKILTVYYTKIDKIMMKIFYKINHVQEGVLNMTQIRYI